MNANHSVQLGRNALQLDGKDFRFYSGEIVPARTPPDRWKDSLEKMKAAGCTTVTFYIPWNWHELAPGQFDFDGHTDPQRNLPAFLELIAKTGLYAVPRPGPFITAEWQHGGIPDWFFREYPEALAFNAAGIRPSLEMPYPPVSYLHPAYLQACRRWFEAVLPILSEWQVTRGGPIIELYLDDEPSYFQLLKGNPLAVDYNPVVVGENGVAGFYQRWLEENYQGNLKLLNQAYHARYTSFADVEPPRRALQAARELPRFLDWYNCKLDIINEYISQIYTWARQSGMEVPLAVLFPYLAQYFSSDRLPRFLSHRGQSIHIAAECYPAGAEGVDHFAEDAIGHIVGNTEAYRSWWKHGDGPPISIEAQSAMAAHLEAHGLEAYYSLLLAHGLNGINFFMMVGGETPVGYELNSGKAYDLFAPIGTYGELRPHYWTIRRLGEWLDTHHKALIHTEPVSAIGYGYYPPYEASGYGIDTLAAGLLDDLRDATITYFGVEGAALGSLATLLPLAGIDFSMLNLALSNLDELVEQRQLWVPSLDFMSLVVQQKLVDYVKAGGHLVLLPRVPYLNENLEPAKGPLAELFPAQANDPQPGTCMSRLTPCKAVNVPSLGIDRAAIADYIDTFELPQGADAYAFEARSEKVCAYTVHSGKGKGTLLGFKLRYFWDPQANLKRLVNGVVGMDGGTVPAYAVGWELIVSMRRGDGGTFLFVVNPSDVPQQARICYTSPGGITRTFPRLIEGITFPRRGGLNLQVETDIPGTLAHLDYTTSQIQTWQAIEGGFRLKLYAYPGAYGEAAFHLPGRPSLVAIDNHPPIQQEWEAESHTLTVVYQHTGEYLDLEVTGY